MTESIAVVPWRPKVEKRDHPFGEEGITSSLKEVAKKAYEGALDPRLRAWAIECLERARREQGLKVNTERERAEILLKAVQKKLWVPDPVGTEWMAGAHLMACVDKDAPCFHGNDCDDLSILLGACFMTVGLYTMIVGHGYGPARKIGHVLCAVRIGGRWYYADPSTDLPLGECVKFSREKLLSVPNIKVLCDKARCLTLPTMFDPDQNDFVEKGDFVGVNGPGGEPILQWINGPGEVLEWLGREDDDVGTKTWDATYKAAEERQFGTSKEDVQVYGAVAGATAATAACAAYPPTAPLAAAGICGYVGGVIGDFVAGFIYDIGETIFGRSDPCKDNPESCVAISESEARLQLSRRELSSQKIIDDAVEAVAKQIRVLNQYGHEMLQWEGESAQQKALKLLIAANEGRRFYEPFPFDLSNKRQWTAEDMIYYRYWYSQRDQRTVELMTSLVAKVSMGIAEDKPGIIRLLPIIIKTPTTKKSNKKSKVVPVVIGTTAAAGVGWLLWSVFA